ncbi:Unknown protein [Striga hermonthica]|uniref:Uncharacterized protein n=1 Tax=Striga hermonthica TaxID=68872 RepID=A0A9N7MLZ0_STRHE|nr:Unknown protein [Striga hermonthica]
MEFGPSEKKSLSYREDIFSEIGKSSKSQHDGLKKRRSNGFFSFRELSIDPSVKSLKHLNSQKLKDGIRKWAKAVARYARQVSNRFGSSR